MKTEQEINKIQKHKKVIKIENSRDKNLYMQGYEQGLLDANLGKIFNKGYVYGIEVENKNFIRNLEEYLWELEERRKKGDIVIGYWQIREMIKEIIKQCKLN